MQDNTDIEVLFDYVAKMSVTMHKLGWTYDRAKFNSEIEVMDVSFSCTNPVPAQVSIAFTPLDIQALAAGENIDEMVKYKVDSIARSYSAYINNGRAQDDE